MPSFIAENRHDLQDHHYIRRATAHNYWVDFARGRLRQYETTSVRDFCLIVNRSDTIDDAYVIPVSIARRLFRDDNLDPDGRGWSATITRGVLTHQGEHLSVSGYYNSFDRLIPIQEDPAKDAQHEQVIRTGSAELALSDLAELIRNFNQEYRTAQPSRRFSLSEQIARPGLIADYLKRFRNYSCQLCHEVGFIQRNGAPYVEAHHIAELHELVPGSLCSDNIVVVCATCHRKLHFAEVHYEQPKAGKMTVVVNGQRHEFEPNVISENQ